MRTFFLSFLVLASAAFAGYAPWGDLHWAPPVASVAALPATGNLIGDTRIETTAFGEYVWNGSSWVAISGGGGSSYTFADSILNSSGTVTLLNDSAAPGDNQYYGTSGTGVFGYHPIPFPSNSAPPGGVSSDVQYNGGGSFSGNSGFTYNGSGVVMATTFVGAFTGNSSTSSALNALPVPCPSGQAALGVLANGNSTGCFTPAGATYTFPDSIINTSGAVTLSGDSASPGNSFYYGTNASGTKGFFGLTYSNLSGTVPTWNQNTTGTAANITATSNSTLTTLPNLGLPYSQLTGSVPTWNQNTTGTASNVTGVVAVVNGGTGSSSPYYANPSPSPSSIMMGTGSSIVAGSAGAGLTLASNVLSVTQPLPNPSPSASGAVLYWNGTAWVSTQSLSISQAQFYGSVTTPGTSSCTWTTTNSTTYVGFAVQSSCPTATAAGNASAPSTKIPAITFTSMPPGDYYFVANGELGLTTAAAAASFRFNDGTNSTNGVVVYGGTAYGSAPTLAGHITYTSPQSNVTIAIQGAATSGFAQINANATTAPSGLEILVYYFPTQAQAVQSVATSPANWAGTSTLSGTTTSATFADPGSITGTVTTSGTPQNISCVAATSLLGITCSGSGIQSGGNYEVCYFGGYVQGSATSNIQTELTDGSNSVIVPSQVTSIYAAAATSPYGACSNYTANTSTPTFKIKALISTGTATIQTGSFSIRSLSTPVNAAILSGGVSTNAAGNWRVESAAVNSVCSTGTCTITSGTGLCSSITRASAGTYTCTFATAFSAVPVCTATTAGASGIIADSGGASTTSVPVSTFVGSTATDGYLNIICQGPR